MKKTIVPMFVLFLIFTLASVAEARTLAVDFEPNNEKGNKYQYDIPPNVPLPYTVKIVDESLTQKSFNSIFPGTAVSSNPAVATISTDGTLEGHSYGSTVISVTYDGKSHTRTINVNRPSSINFEKDEIELLTGQYTPASITAYYMFNLIDLSTTANFVSSNPGVANVSGGNINALNPGTTTITANFEGRSDTITVTVKPGLSGGLPNKPADQGFHSPNKLSAIQYLNDIRAKMGLKPLIENEYLNNSAQHHSDYLAKQNIDQIYAKGGSLHDEDLNNGGINNRINVFGYKNGYGEVISPTDNENNRGIQSLINAPLHRTVMISPYSQDVGVGLNTSGTLNNTVLNLGFQNLYGVDEGYRNTYTVNYPYDNQRDVPIFWYANEMPNPLSTYHKEGAKVGYPISIHTSNMRELTFTAATIKDDKNNDVPYYLADRSTMPQSISADVILIPKEPLKSGTTYTVHFEGVGGGTKVTNDWSFTTQATQLSHIEFEFMNADILVGEQKRFKLTAYYTDSTNEDITTKAQYVIDPVSKIELSNGSLIGKLAYDNIVVKATYQNKTAVMNIKVNGPNKPVINKFPVFNDIKDHWASLAIEWGTNEGVIDGYDDGSFKPNKLVSEAEFITMLLRAYKIPLQDDPVSTHWADKYYSFAKEYNFATSDKEDARDSFINRTSVAEIISGIDGVSKSGNEAIQYLLDKRYSNGKNSATVEGYAGSEKLTRAEALQFIKNILENGLSQIKKRY
ncbi:S-layer homology domain-containing protein [Paenibacillus qinlingensis]|uniref:S-layer homology domain-containing protein n=1 Tax=Paenibacillus qinlingensis TaxID=1837343 RepID=UPI0015631B11|nr:S-layer homology domain-containing protein [Paenibacillus qinlingensis]NQX63569.1 S-layer homology domain-containing protein [Paenibacillus qinlingensis]